jgi:hypothetical protein
MKDFTAKYNDRIDELNDAKLIIRELKVKLKEKDLSENKSRNSNTLLSTAEDKVVVATFKKLFDSSIFTDDKDFTIDD